MASLLKAAILGAALAAPLSLGAHASAPFDHETRSIRATPVANQDLRGNVRYARSRISMNDAWEGADDDERPRRATRQANRGKVQQRRAARPARVIRNANVERPVQPRQRREAAYVPSGGLGSGIASYYWQGQRTASGSTFNPDGLTAAHRSLPFGTRVRVTHLGNGRTVDVTINDRGPFIGGRVIDLSRGAARVIGMTGQGLANVRMEVIGR